MNRLSVSLLLACGAVGAVAAPAPIPSLPLLTLRGQRQQQQQLTIDPKSFGAGIQASAIEAGFPDLATAYTALEVKIFEYLTPVDVEGKLVTAGVLSTGNPNHDPDLEPGYVNLLSVKAELRDCSTTEDLCSDRFQSGYCTFLAPASVNRFIITTQAVSQDVIASGYIEIRSTPEQADDDTPPIPATITNAKPTPHTCPLQDGDDSTITLHPYVKTDSLTVNTGTPVTISFASGPGTDLTPVTITCSTAGGAQSLSTLLCESSLASECNLKTTTKYPSDLTPLGESTFDANLNPNTDYILRLFNTGLTLQGEDDAIAQSVATCYITPKH